MNSCAGQCQGKGGTFLSFILVFGLTILEHMYYYNVTDVRKSQVLFLLFLRGIHILLCKYFKI